MTRKRRNEKYDCQKLENRGGGHVPQHHNPVKLGLVLDGLARNEMLFDVAQDGSLNTVSAMGPSGTAAYDPECFRSMINRKTRNSASDYW